MGSVWAATHAITGGRVALKFVKAVGDARAEMHKRFLREARAATLVEHPNVVTIRDVFDHEEMPVIVMDLLQGETLAALLAREGPLAIGDAARLILPVIAAVGAAHEAGLIHRDLKPENVFLSRATSGEMVRVLDFGIAKLVRNDADGFASTAVTQSGAVIGTPAYMAPEQLFGEKDLDYRADIWAIGVMLYEMLAGSRPIDGENFGQLAKKLLSQSMPSIAVKRGDLPEDVVGMIARMLARERNDRLHDLREAAEILARHGSQKRPSFGAPRLRPLTDSDPDARFVVGEGTDPNARTMQSPSGRRPTDPTAETVLAQSNPRQDSAAAHITATTSSPRAWQGVALFAAALVALAIVASRFIPAPATTPITTPVASSPLVAPPVAPIPMVVWPTPTPNPVEAASAPSPASASASIVAKIAGKPPKTVAPSNSASALPTASAPPPPPPPSTTSTGGSGLVTKPPF